MWSRRSWDFDLSFTLRARIRTLLDSGDHSIEEVSRRIRILHMGSRPVEPEHFQVIANALLSRRRLSIDHYNRRIDKTVAREVSPQRLVYYRDNWYLDTWCHLRNDLRSFAVDVIRRADLLGTKAKPVAEQRLDEVLGSGYGIFAGAKTLQAVLRFSPVRSRWVSRETWHPQQVGKMDGEGRWVLEFPYSDDTEVSMDILKYGPDVEVLRPASLRRKVAVMLAEAAAAYR